MFKKIAAAAFLAAAVASCAVAAYDPDQPSILVGTSSTYPPYGFIDTEGKLSGFDTELMYAIGEKLGKEIQWFDSPKFDALLAALSAGKVDCAIAGITPTEERAKRMLFSDLYEVGNIAFIVRDDDDSITGMESLKGKIGTVEQGHSQHTYLTPLVDQYGFTLKPFNSHVECVMDLFAGRCDFVCIDTPVAEDYLARDRFKDHLKIAFTQVVPEMGKAMGFPMGNEALQAQINQALKELDEEGFIAAQKVKWGLAPAQ